MESQSHRSNGYPVEVSGWDASDNFFVEKTVLSWPDDDKEIRVRCTLRQASVIFVRLLQPLARNNNFPIAYQVKRIGPQDADGKSRVYLVQLHPSPGHTEESERSNDPIPAA